MWLGAEWRKASACFLITGILGKVCQEYEHLFVFISPPSFLDLAVLKIQPSPTSYTT